MPTVIGALTSGNMTFAAWRTVFLLSTVIYLAGNLAYVLLISGEVQEWNYTGYKQKRAAPLAMEEKTTEDDGESKQVL